MSGDIFPRPYLVVGAANQIVKNTGYQLLALRDGVAQMQGYSIIAGASDVSAGTPATQAYAVLSNPASAAAVTTYAAVRNDAAVQGSRGYVVLRSFYPPYEELDLEYPFADERFPTNVSYGSSGGPGFKTTVFTVDSGVTHAVAEWDRLRARYDVTFDHCPQNDMEAVENFFYSMRGSAVGFRYKDWSDYQIVNQNVVVGDGNSKTFQLFKRYRSGAQVFDRIITKPVRSKNGTMMMDGVELVLNRDYYLNYTTGVITFNVAPSAGAVGTMDYIEFDVPVRFDTDSLSISAEDFNQFSISSLSLIEILV